MTPAFDFTLCCVAPQIKLITGELDTTFLPHANKTVAKWPGDCRPYDDVFWWYFTSKSCPTLDAFAEALRWLADQPRMMIVRGALKPHVRPNTRALRRYADPDERANSFDAVPRPWMAMDFDDVLVSSGLGAGDRVAEAGEYVRSLLPPAFHHVRGIVTATSSTGLAKNFGVGPAGEDHARLRMFFLLDDPVDDEDLRDWAKGFRHETGINLDPVTFGTVQPVYTARPFFKDIEDPVPVDGRVFILDGAVDRVSLPDFDYYIRVTKLRQYAQRKYRERTGRDWRRTLEVEMGGIDGYHEPIWRALGMAIKVDVPEDEIIAYTLNVLREKADRARIEHYDRRYLKQCIKSFVRRDQARRTERD
jgi:hypothetical protein